MTWILARHDVELLADFLADAHQNRTAGARFLRFRQVVDDLHPGQIGGDGPTSAFAAGARRSAGPLEGLRLVLLLRLLGLVEQGKLLLLADVGLFLGLRAVDDQVQEPKALLKRLMFRSHVDNESFQCGRVVREGIDVHSPNNLHDYSI